MWFVTIIALLGIGYYFGSRNPVKKGACEKLKNALLAHALDVVGEDFDYASKDLKSFDGATLPRFPKEQTESDTYFQYIMDKDVVKEDPLYSESCVDRVTAVEKYLNLHFCEDEQVRTFFEKYMAKIR